MKSNNVTSINDNFIQLQSAALNKSCINMPEDALTYTSSDSYSYPIIHRPDLTNKAIGTATPNSVEFCEIRPWMYIEDLL